MLYAVLFIYGLVVGSFGYAWVFRIHNKEKISEGRSHCDHCDHELAVKDLVPLFSWLYLRGKCRYCKKKLSKVHPITELSSGLIFLGAGLTWPHGLESSDFIIYFVIWLLVLANLTVVSIYDFLYKEIPFILQKFNMLFAGSLFLYGWNLDILVSAGVLDSIIGLAVLFGGFLAIHHFSDGKWLGGADVYLVGPFGLVLGTLLGFLSTVLASYVALIGILIGIASHHKQGKQIPFGPFLSIGFVLAFLYGQNLIDFIAG